MSSMSDFSPDLMLRSQLEQCFTSGDWTSLAAQDFSTPARLCVETMRTLQWNKVKGAPQRPLLFDEAVALSVAAVRGSRSSTLDKLRKGHKRPHTIFFFPGTASVSGSPVTVIVCTSKLTSMLGKGSWKNVRFGWHVQDRKWVAFASVRLEAHASEERRVLRNEEALLRRFAGTRYVGELIASDQTSTRWYCVQPYYPGEYHPKNYSSVRARLEAAWKATQGVAVLHLAGVAHRDIKPANYRVAKDGNVVLIDLGNSGPDPATKVCGSPGYAAPELCREMRRSSRDSASFSIQNSFPCDIWALACTFHRILEFTHAYLGWVASASSGEALIRSVCDLTDADVDSALTAGSFSPDVRALLARMLVIDPRKRIDISTVQSELRGILEREGLTCDVTAGDPVAAAAAAGPVVAPAIAGPAPVPAPAVGDPVAAAAAVAGPVALSPPS